MTTTTSPALHRALAGLAVTAVAALTLVTTSTPSAVAGPVRVAADPSITDSAQTRSGEGPFAALSVTVGKTRTLGNEAVKVAWRWTDANPGQHATVSDTAWQHDYLSIFQCWGDDAAGPRREQCQYGGQFAETDGVNTRLQPFSADSEKRFAVSREVGPVDVFGKRIAAATDPLEDTDPHGYPAKGSAPGIVPMQSAPSAEDPKGQTVTSVDTGQFFDRFGTNEIPLARTNGDGTGSVYFEAQTVYESQFLGCGARTGSGSAATGRSCWLVVVPRDATDADGTDVRTRPGGSTRSLYSSPLSLSNWKHRIVFPLQFEPVKEPCALGGVERPVVGHESLSIAMSSWQGPLCRQGQGFFYATTTDDIARSTVSSDLPKLSVFTDPLAKDAVPATKGAPVYAPLAASGVTVAFFIEREYNSASDPALRPNNGSRVEGLRLNQRLVAKLLTESYRYSTWVNDGGPAHLQDAPLSLVDDPEFIALNKDLVGSDDVTHLRNQRESLAKIYVTPDDSDAVRLTWEWVLGDADARAFLSGKNDPWGMHVNQYYKGLARYETGGVVRADVPRLEEACTTLNIGNASTGTPRTKDLCALDAAPYVASFDQGAALTARGQQTGAGSFVYDAGCECVKAPRPDPQLVGQRALITLTDTPSAARRGLVTAALPNAAGTFVTPTRSSMGASVQQAVATSTPGVSRVAPTKVTDAGYPLTRLSYAATTPQLLDAESRKDYANLIDVVATDGQEPGTSPGTLPEGYAPLPGPLRASAVRAADAIRSPAPVAAPATTPTPTAAGPSTEPPTGFSPAPAPADVPVPVAAAPVGAVVPGVDAPRAAATPVGATTLASAVAKVVGPWALPALAVVALLAGIGGQVVRLLGHRRTSP